MMEMIQQELTVLQLNGSKYIKIDESAIGSTIRVYMRGTGRGGSTTTRFEDSSHNKISNIASVWRFSGSGIYSSNKNHVIPERAAWIRLSSSADANGNLYTIEVVK